MTGAAPSGVVTFLFTDVEGSTRRWEADADGMRASLAAHDKVLRNAIEMHGGLLFKHTGDGVCAAFASPRSAVDAAVAAGNAGAGGAADQQRVRQGDTSRACASDGPAIRLRPSLSTAQSSSRIPRSAASRASRAWSVGETLRRSCPSPSAVLGWRAVMMCDVVRIVVNHVM